MIKSAQLFRVELARAKLVALPAMVVHMYVFAAPVFGSPAVHIQFCLGVGEQTYWKPAYFG
jgi:hypothetical protein